MEQKIKNEVGSLSMEFTDFGKEMNKELCVVEIFYIKSKKNIIRKNRIKKNRVTNLKKFSKFNTYPYLTNLGIFWENVFKYFPKIKIQAPTIFYIYKNFNEVLKKAKIKDLKNNKIKIPNISLLPEYNSVLFPPDPSIFSYFEKLRKKLKGNKDFYFTLRNAEVYHNMKITTKNDGYPSKKKVRKTVQVGDDYNRDRKKFVSLKRILDKDNDIYGEEVKDIETNEIIRECYEPLTEHQGRGNAKNKKNRRNEYI